MSALDKLAQDLIDAGGAILYWQLPKILVDSAISSGLAYIADDDCLVHRDAVKICDGHYEMK